MWTDLSRPRQVGLAQGLNLGLPLMGSWMPITSHSVKIATEFAPESRDCRIAIGSAMAVWHYAPKYQTEDGTKCEEVKCLCGMREPSMPHVIWACKHFDGQRREFLEGVIPANRAEERLLVQLAPVDLVLVEGYKRDAHPKIEAHRSVTGNPLIAPDDPTIRAVASDCDLSLDRPLFHLDDTTAIADFILKEVDL